MTSPCLVINNLNMKVSPILRLTLLGLIFLVNFFVLIVSINTISSTNTELNLIKNSKSKQLSQKNNDKNNINRRIEEELSNDQNTENIQRISSNDTTSIKDLLPKNNSGSDPSKQNSQSTILSN